MITGYQQYIRLKVKQLRHGLVNAFNDLRLAFKIPILPFAVRFLDVDEEEVIIIPGFSQRSKLIPRCFAFEIDHLHAD